MTPEELTARWAEALDRLEAVVAAAARTAERAERAEAALDRVRVYIDGAEEWGDPLHSDVIRDLMEVQQ